VIADRDPIVARALDLFVPELDIDPSELVPAAHAGAVKVRAVRRRRQTAGVVAFAALLLFAGAAVAAQKFDLFSLLHTNDRNGARFSVSPSRTYRGAAPLALTCPGARTGGFVCHATGPMASGTRRYDRSMRVDKVPQLTRNGMLAALSKAQASGADPAQIARLRADLADVGDDFLGALAVLSRVNGVSGRPTSPAGTERVPPRGVPAWVACRELTLLTYRCRPLAALVGVATGTPLYELRPSHEWRAVSAPPKDQVDIGRLLERLLGRKITAAESRFFVDLATVTITTGNSSGPVRSTLTGGPDPRAIARLAPSNLGVRTRVVSVTVQPLPRGHLPGGLTRSGGIRLYRVTFDIPRADGVHVARRHTIYVFVTRRGKLGVWLAAWVASKP
jgi:hypothetical protein